MARIVGRTDFEPYKLVIGGEEKNSCVDADGRRISRSATARTSSPWVRKAARRSGTTMRDHATNPQRTFADFALSDRARNDGWRFMIRA
jgi:hypothetical protein